MTTRRRSPNRSFRRSGRRQKISWLQSALEFVISAGVGAILFSDLTPPPMRAASTEGTATIKRLIMTGLFGAQAQSIQPQRMAMGIYVVSHEAFDQTAFSDPTADEGQDWYYWTQRAVQPNGISSQGDYWDIDLRTSRRLRAGYKLIMVVNNPLNDVVTNLTVGLRTLWTQES